MDNKDILFQNDDFEQRMDMFHDKLKRHLKDEYLYLSEKKDNLDAEALQIRMEMDQKDKALFPNVEKGDMRKYFSPISITGIKEKQKDEKEKQLTINHDRIRDEISLMESRMNEIMDFLRDLDKIVEEDRSSDIEEDLYEDEEISDEEYEEEYSEEEDANEIKEVNIQNYRYDYFKKYPITYPQMIRNLYNISDFYHSEYENFDILIEFNDNNIDLDASLNKAMIRQILFNIDSALEEFTINMVLLQGKVDDKTIDITLNYVCDNNVIDTVKINYIINR